MHPSDLNVWPRSDQQRKEHPVGKRVPASMKTRKRIEELMDGTSRASEAKSAFVKPATRLLLEEAAEAEARDALGREYYRHGRGQGHRNGYRLSRLKSAE